MRYREVPAIFELVIDIIRTNVLTKFYEGWTIYATTRKNATPPSGHFHEDLSINVASRLLTRQNIPTPGNHFFNQHLSDSHKTKNATAHCGYVFQAIGTIFELVQDIIRTNVLTKFHKDWTINVTFRVNKRIKPETYIVKTNVLTKFHEDWTINVTFRVLTSFYYRYMENAPPPGGNVFQSTETTSEHIQDTIETNLQTKFHEDPTMNQASSMLTRQLFMSHNRRQ
ncbi:hypothetical protein DPMN_080024 [Dreissena polymorpha]|uniref:Uncharacterized protein n=1 Tax=Dreissena polymorpha TaxID=45954 RepID=A0A9D3YQ36_DREPO|nr:hypothetical protein DPMN_080024 [Dreissena polymorpha]